MDTWEYIASNSIIVPFKFLSQGRGFLPVITAVKKIMAGGGVRAGLGKLAIIKARTWLARDDKKNLEDFRFLITKLHKLGEGFGSIVLAVEDKEEIEDLETLKIVGEDTGDCHKALLLEILDLCVRGFRPPYLVRAR